MPSVNEFIVDKATVRFGDDSDPFEVVYRPSALDGDRNELFKKANDSGDSLAASYLLTGTSDDDALVLSWNVTGPIKGRRVAVDDDGKERTDDQGRMIYERYEIVQAGDVVPIDPTILRFMDQGWLARLYSEININHMELTSAGVFTRGAKNPSLNGSRNR